MSAPFGDHPTFARYLVWARDQGCDIRQGVGAGDDGRPCSVTEIIAPDKKRWVHAVGLQHTDFLVPTMIAYLDRRLGLTSPFFSLPE